MICGSCGYQNAPTLQTCNLCGEILRLLPRRPKKSEAVSRSDLRSTTIDRAIAKRTGKRPKDETKVGGIERLQASRSRLTERLAQLVEVHDEHTSVLQAQIDAAHETQKVQAQLDTAETELEEDKESLLAAQAEVQTLRKRVADIRVVLNRAIELRLEALAAKESLASEVEHLRRLREELRTGPPKA